MLNTRGEVSFGAIVATIGAVLIGLGFAWLLTLNWADIPSVFKIIILVFATISAYGIGVFFRIYGYPKIGASLLFLGALLYTLSIFLIAQIFNLATSLQMNANLLLLSWVGIVFASYIFNSSSSLVIALSEFLIWISFQFFAFYEKENSFFGFPDVGVLSLGILAIIYLIVAVFLYGLTQIKKSINHKFFEVYRFWTAFYILLIAYILSFQMLIPLLWQSGFQISAGVLIFLIVLSLVAIVTAAIGINMSLNNAKLTGKEVFSFLLILCLFIVFILSTSFVSSTLGSCYLKNCYEISNQKECTSINLPNQVCSWQENRCDNVYCEKFKSQDSCEGASKKLNCKWNWNSVSSQGYCNYDYNTGQNYESQQQICTQHNNDRKSCLSNNVCQWRAGGGYGYGNGNSLSLKVWLVWIIDNILFVMVILSVMGYGVRYKSSKLVNLGIIFFVLDIITRYIGFWLDFSGYVGFAIMSIVGGIILILGGWGIEHWRRRLIEKTEMRQQTSYAIY
mgnify:CR=1 FL=1